MPGYERDASLPDVGVPWDSIPTSDTVEEGRYVIRVGYFQEKKSQEGKRMAVLFSTIDEGTLKDVPFPIQNYVLGTEEDPLCTLDPNTWRKSFGGRQLNQLLEAAGSPKNEKSLGETLRRAESARLQVYVTKTQQDKGQYAGSFQNRIVRCAPYGQEMNVPGKAAGTAAQASTPVQPRSRMRPTFNGSGPENQEQVTVGPEDVGHVEEVVPGLND